MLEIEFTVFKNRTRKVTLMMKSHQTWLRVTIPIVIVMMRLMRIIGKRMMMFLLILKGERRDMVSRLGLLLSLGKLIRMLGRRGLVSRQRLVE